MINFVIPKLNMGIIPTLINKILHFASTNEWVKVCISYNDASKKELNKIVV